MLLDIGSSAQMLLDRGHSAQEGAVRKSTFSVILPDIGSSAQMLLDIGHSAQAGAVKKSTFIACCQTLEAQLRFCWTQDALLRQVLLERGYSTSVLLDVAHTSDASR
jgi:hypothetical protein